MDGGVVNVNFDWRPKNNVSNYAEADAPSWEAFSPPGRGAPLRSPLLSTHRCAWMAPGRGIKIMKSVSPPWVWIALALALLVIGYVVTPPAVIQQATALWSWG